MAPGRHDGEIAERGQAPITRAIRHLPKFRVISADGPNGQVHPSGPMPTPAPEAGDNW